MEGDVTMVITLDTYMGSRIRDFQTIEAAHKRTRLENCNVI